MRGSLGPHRARPSSRLPVNDHQMPGLSGTELARAAEHTDDDQVIILSNFSEAEVLRRTRPGWPSQSSIPNWQRALLRSLTVIAAKRLLARTLQTLE